MLFKALQNYSFSLRRTNKLETNVKNTCLQVTI